MNFKDKVILITGGSRGIGATTAFEFARLGGKVAINYSSKADFDNSESANLLLEDIEKEGGVAKLYDFDLSGTIVGIKQMILDIQTTMGTISYVIFNAYIPFVSKPILDLSWRELNKKVSMDIRQLFLITKLVLPNMIEQNKGVFIGVSSGLSKKPTYNFMPYCITKSSLNSFIRSIAYEYGNSGIRANIIAPGFTKTDSNKEVSEVDRNNIIASTPLKRLAEPKDIAKSIVLLASDHAHFISGGYLPVDGGLTML